MYVFDSAMQFLTSPFLSFLLFAVQVFQGCRAGTGIGKREASSPEGRSRDRERDRERSGGDRDGGRERGGEDGDDIRNRFQGNQPRPTTAAGTNLGRLVKDVRSHIKEYRR